MRTLCGVPSAIPYAISNGPSASSEFNSCVWNKGSGLNSVEFERDRGKLIGVVPGVLGFGSGGDMGLSGFCSTCLFFYHHPTYIKEA